MARRTDHTTNATEEILLKAEHLGYTTHGKELLRHIHLTLRKGELFSLIGPNGAGKTTLVNLLLGLEKPTEGHIWRKEGLRVGYVPQRMATHPFIPMTVAYFIGGDGEMLDTVLHETGIERLTGRMLHQLSGGELQRVMLARAVLKRPDILILDEPVQGVDAEGQLSLYRYIDEIRQRMGCGVLLVSHDLNWVLSSSEWVLCLNQHMCCEGRPEHVRGNAAFKAMFPQSAIVAPYTHHHDHHHAGVHVHGEDCAHD
ncbi:ATP-binding cassette domain-containing protein [bacterium]|nr:ATP-binding cassette domain-containing protein [bacterium]